MAPAVEKKENVADSKKEAAKSDKDKATAEKKEEPELVSILTMY